jgi:hypothetical protein
VFVLEPIAQEDLHWLAGLLEGEGSFLSGPPSSPHLPSLQVVMADEDVMLRVGRLLGRRVYRIKPRRSHWQMTFTVRMKGLRAVEWMQRLRPLMGERRRAQIDRAIGSYKSRSGQLLDDDQVRRALVDLASGRSVREVAEKFGVSQWCIYDLRLGRTHKHVSRNALRRVG